jgi:hypothetical protein
MKDLLKEDNRHKGDSKYHVVNVSHVPKDANDTEEDIDNDKVVMRYEKTLYVRVRNEYCSCDVLSKQHTTIGLG